MDKTELNNALLKIREEMAEQDRLSRAVERAERSLAGERRRLQELASELEQETKDVRRLEGASLAGLVYAILGSKEERLDAERQEMLAANLKYENCRRQVAALDREAADLRARLAGLGRPQDLQARYDRLLAEKERLLAVDGSPSARRLGDISGELAGRRAAERELREAEAAGEQAQAGLERVLSLLDSAGTWGTIDMLGGGMLVSAIKHSKLDEAHAAVQDVQPLLQRFERELADVAGQTGLEFEAGGLAAFADIFIDNLLIDLMVQSRINETRAAAQDMRRRVSDLLSRLKKELAEAGRAVQSLEAERRSLLEQP